MSDLIFAKKNILNNVGLNHLKNRYSETILEVALRELESENLLTLDFWSFDFSLSFLKRLTGYNLIKPNLLSAYPLEKEQRGGNLFSKFMVEIRNYFLNQGFKELKSSIITDLFWSFEALEIPVYHPARNSEDTFYLDETSILRTHTTSSNFEKINELKDEDRYFSLQKVFRRETEDSTHLLSFYQLEITINLEPISIEKWFQIIQSFLASLGLLNRIKFIPTYYGYTSPSWEVQCYCNQSQKYLEIGGGGIFRASVARHIHAEKGIGAGFGLERLFKICYELEDMPLKKLINLTDAHLNF